MIEQLKSKNLTFKDLISYMNKDNTSDVKNKKSLIAKELQSEIDKRAVSFNEYEKILEEKNSILCESIKLSSEKIDMNKCMDNIKNAKKKYSENLFFIIYLNIAMSIIMMSMFSAGYQVFLISGQILLYLKTNTLEIIPYLSNIGIFLFIVVLTFFSMHKIDKAIKKKELNYSLKKISNNDSLINMFFNDLKREDEKYNLLLFKELKIFISELKIEKRKNIFYSFEELCNKKTSDIFNNLHSSQIEDIKVGFNKFKRSVEKKYSNYEQNKFYYLALTLLQKT